MSMTPVDPAPARPRSAMRRIVESMDAIFYADYQTEWDNAVGRETILSRMGPGHVVLDVGAGGGKEWTRFRGHAARVCGIDPDPRVIENPHLDEARLGGAEQIPYPDATFDLAFAWNVAEHLPDPAAAFREVARVLKPGGAFVVKTPNVWHYVTGLSRLMPNSLHGIIIERTMHRRSRDVFPTLYRCNSEARIRRLAAESGLSVREIRHLEPRPEYLRFSPFTYPLGIVYERIVNSTPRLAPLRVVMIAVLEKRS